ncbi:hypothetical protein KCU68_g18559, partial [Aureobasidium melanogenum]
MQLAIVRNTAPSLAGPPFKSWRVNSTTSAKKRSEPELRTPSTMLVRNHQQINPEGFTSDTNRLRLTIQLQATAVMNGGIRLRHHQQQSTTEACNKDGPRWIMEDVLLISSIQIQAQTTGEGHDYPEYSRPAEVQTQPERSNSKSYRHRARDAGYVGAAAAAAMPFPNTLGQDGIVSQERGRRSSGHHNEARLASRDKMQNANQHANFRGPPAGQDNTSRIPDAQQSLHTSRVGASGGIRAAVQHQDPDPIPPKSVRTGHKHGPAYDIPPQTAGGQDARDYVGFSDVQPVAPPQVDRSAKQHHHHGVSNLFHRHQHKDGTYRKRPELQEWRQGGVVRLLADDHNVQDSVKATAHMNTPWWDGRGSRKSVPAQDSSGAYDGTYDEPAKAFRPPLFLKCGPLLRYTGMRREKTSQTNR